MQQTAANKIGVTLVALALIGGWFYGCGSGDILDENQHRYLTYVEFYDGEEGEATLDVDIVQNNDCDNNASTPGPVEDFFNLFAKIEIEVGEGVPGISMDNYKITFQPLTSTDQFGNVFTPAPAPTTYHGVYALDIETNSSQEFTTTCMEGDMKRYLGALLPVSATEARYEVIIKMSFTDEYDIPVDITIRRVLYLGRYDNCS